ncbi:hypothetical protein NF27_EY01960 [Candidatus Jidaibacter acanthamoeba]|uniref:Nucleoside-diphosphate-sugar epimerase n=1 Tax=Candidatus Jidaibacter acanthamoebae TaxID=86105 RepID=A0A0C1QYP1_9RICK|nr:mitochondrial fission ELM1 family protein [Candidatus Jidaibacter acanthamoeba]KIE05100.1 hypothetical protein NF27_EY01960 [Candidatus Jidaibacter acanthamoeba]
MSLKVFVLTDDRAGNSNQAIALAKLLGFDYEEKRLEYNKLAAIPFFFKSGFELLNKNSIEHLIQDEPDIIISAGRRAASVALALKDRNRSTKIIQILGAEKNYKLFDLVILPEHDRKQFISYPDNVIFTPLAISCFSRYELEQESLKWQPVLAKYKQPYLAVLIGGNSKKCKFKEKHITDFINNVTNIAKNYSGSLLITSSRRTPIALVGKLKQALEKTEASYFLYEPEKYANNPYKAFLSNAKAILVTGDSISMCSEACSLGKPVFIYAPRSMLSSKHMAFVKHLFKVGLAAPISNKFEPFTPLKHNYTQMLIENIKQRLHL